MMVGAFYHWTMFRRMPETGPTSASYRLDLVESGVQRIVKGRMFRNAQGGRKMARLEEYATDFLQLLEGSTKLFPEQVQRRGFKETVERYWKESFTLDGKRRAGPEGQPVQVNPPKLARLLKKDAIVWKHYDRLGGFSSEFVEQILSENDSTLSEIASDLLGSEALHGELHEGLKDCVRSMYSRDWFAPGHRSWIVLCGLGEDEYFPSMLEYQVGSIMDGKLRYAQSDDATITPEVSATVIPLALCQVGRTASLPPDQPAL